MTPSQIARRVFVSYTNAGMSEEADFADFLHRVMTDFDREQAVSTMHAIQRVTAEILDSLIADKLIAGE